MYLGKKSLLNFLGNFREIAQIPESRACLFDMKSKNEPTLYYKKKSPGFYFCHFIENLPRSFN